MKNLVIVTAQGYNKEEALAAAKVNLQIHADSTISFKKAGSPTGDDLKTFAEGVLEGKGKGLTGIGYVITVEAGSADTRERPYKVDTIVTDGQRDYTTVYEGLINDNQIVFTAKDKAAAEKAAKDYVTANKVDVSVRLVKVVTKGQPIALKVAYTPAAGTKLGTYTFFGYEA